MILALALICILNSRAFRNCSDAGAAAGAAADAVAGAATATDAAAAAAVAALLGVPWMVSFGSHYEYVHDFQHATYGHLSVHTYLRAI